MMLGYVAARRPPPLSKATCSCVRGSPGCAEGIAIAQASRQPPVHTSDQLAHKN